MDIIELITMVVQIGAILFLTHSITYFMGSYSRSKTVAKPKTPSQQRRSTKKIIVDYILTRLGVKSK